MQKSFSIFLFKFFLEPAFKVLKLTFFNGDLQGWPVEKEKKRQRKREGVHRKGQKCKNFQEQADAGIQNRQAIKEKREERESESKGKIRPAEI